MDPSYRAHAARVGLTIADPDRFTIRRLRAGARGGSPQFRYRDEATGRSPGRAAALRIRALGIPPAWRQVRCASDERSHVLATGIDGAGRLQYVYHPDWNHVRDAIKAERTLRFGRALPFIRARVERDLELELSRRRGPRRSLRRLAAPLAARLVDKGAMRPGGSGASDGGEGDARGATTLLAGDVRVSGDRVRLDYIGKSGKAHALALDDPLAARAVAKVKRAGTARSRSTALMRRVAGRVAGRMAGRVGGRPAGRNGGDKPRRLFAWEGPCGTGGKLTPARLNRYLSEAAADAPGVDAGVAANVSAKDFRTFHGSVAALEVLHARRHASGERQRREALAEAARAAAKRLRNTPAVARASYVLPSIVEAFERGALPDGLMRGPCRRGLSRAETALMRHVEAQLA